MRFETLVNVVLRSESITRAVETIQAGQWLLRLSPRNHVRYKIVPLWPWLSRAWIEDIVWVSVVPHVEEKGERTADYFVGGYAGAVLVQGEADSLEQAATYLASEEWHIPIGGITVVTYAAPAAVGEFARLLA